MDVLARSDQSSLQENAVSSAMYAQYRVSRPVSSTRMSDRLSQELDIEMCRLQEMMSSLEELDQELKEDETTLEHSGILDPGGGNAIDSRKDTSHPKRDRSHKVRSGPWGARSNLFPS